MPNRFTSHLLASSLCLAASVAQAQVKVSLGPKVGFNAASAGYQADDRFAYFSALTGTTGFRPGFEAGLLATVSWGHWQLQPAVLYAQKGFSLRGTESNTVNADGVNPAPYEYRNRLNYLTLPLNVAYTQHKNGQGIHLFAGPYLGVLLGGHYSLSFPSSTFTARVGGEITAKKRPANFDPYTDFTQYSQRLDAGFQLGAGYRYGPALLQAGCSIGLPNLAPSDYATATYIGTGPDYRLFALQVSLAYLFTLKS